VSDLFHVSVFGRRRDPMLEGMESYVRLMADDFYRNFGKTPIDVT
jgi:hypothetical protein